MSEKEVGSEYREEDHRVLGYRIDEDALIFKEGRYLVIKSDGSERKIGQTPGKILWTLAQEGSVRPGQWVPKEVLLEFVLSKEALKTNICRIKKDYIPGKIVTKRNEGYRIDAQIIEPVYQGESTQLAIEPPKEPLSPENPLEMKVPDPSPITRPETESVQVGKSEATLEEAGKGYRGILQSLAAVAVLALTLVIVYRAIPPTGPRHNPESVTEGQEQPYMRSTPEVEDQTTRDNLPALNPYVYVVGPETRHPVPLRVKVPAEYDALLLTLFVEGASPTFAMKLTDMDRTPVIKRTLRKDEHQTVSVVIPANRLKNTTYQLKIYPVGKESQASNYTLQVQMK